MSLCCLSPDLIPPDVCVTCSTLPLSMQTMRSAWRRWTSMGLTMTTTWPSTPNALNNMIYNTARDFVIEHYKYPEGIRTMDLQYCFVLPILMKIDAFHYIQLGTYDPEHLIKDVSEAIGMVHIKGYMYKWIMQDLVEQCWILFVMSSQTPFFFTPKLFLITNSPFSFVDKCMRYMVGKDLKDFFDRVIVQADKPHFFNDCEVSMKCFYVTCCHWDKINSWRGSSVLYFGNHLYSDLAVSESFISPLIFVVHSSHWQQRTGRKGEALTLVNKRLLHFIILFHSLIKPCYILSFTCYSPSSRTVSPFFRLRTKNLFNMASISCLLNYDLAYTFYLLCIPLQHEVPLWMDQICSGCMKTSFLEEMAHIC
uniref:Uncharacterized protein n=1 Tax=Hucho hucho TaxID=62062 RepID=A0A4W5MH39_9TELE